MARGSQVEISPEGQAPPGKPGVWPSAPHREEAQGKGRLLEYKAQTAQKSQPSEAGQGVSVPGRQGPP